MEILQTHNHKLRFKIDNNAPPKYMERWKEFKYKCENGDNKNIVERSDIVENHYSSKLVHI
jgi:hypothetical protein